MTELQKCELNILRKALQVIHDNHLKYYLVCGTALGAVKYGGFIPWDDDIDIALPREDYERFIKIVADSKDEEFTLQNHRYNSNIPFFYSKIRSSKTTYIERSVSGFNINHGVYIDVFPLDGYPKNVWSQILFECKKKVLWITISSVFHRDCMWKNTLLFPLRVYASRHLNSLVRRYEQLVSKYNISDSDLICNFGNSPLKLEYSPKEYYGVGTWIIFEGLDVCVPEKYDEYLTQKYGDWRSDPPLEQQVGHHYYTICDLKKPYTYYTKE